VIVGAGLLMLNTEAAEVPPPGAGLVTVMFSVPAVAMSAAVIAAERLVALLKVVTRAAPLTFTTEPATKFVPVTVSENAAPPTMALVGAKPVIVGTPLFNAKVAVTVVAALSVTLQVPVPVHPPPLQPVNVDPAVAAAVSTIAVPELKFAVHVDPQLIPAGALVTVPAPVPALVTCRASDWAKVAVTLLVRLAATEHVPVPLQAPLHPVNTDPVPGTAVNVNAAPSGTVSWHDCAQLGTEAPEMDTLPLPLIVTK
jgi:hypothetical protein